MNDLTKEQWIGVVAALVVVLLFFGYSYLPNFFNQLNPNMNLSSQQSSADESAQAPSGELKIEDLTAGTGQTAGPGDAVTVNYVGTFENGAKFDSSADHGGPFTFTLGAGQVIAGWDLGVMGMKEGGKRRLTVPPDLGYGPDDYGPIPGNSTLIFEVELVKVAHPAS